MAWPRPVWPFKNLAAAHIILKLDAVFIAAGLLNISNFEDATLAACSTAFIPPTPADEAMEVTMAPEDGDI